MKFSLYPWMVPVVLATSVAFSCAADHEDATGETVISVIRNYRDEKPGDRGAAIVQWNWTAEQKQRAGEFSQLRIVEEPDQHCLELTVTAQMPWDKQDSYRALLVGPDLLSPRVDTVRLRCRVAEGSFTISFGGPTVYFGHSDVNSLPVTLDTNNSSQWRTVDISLVNDLSRNYRRARFARQSPVIYYTRWIQEPMYLLIHRGSVGKLMIDRIELVNKGRGHPYPVFDASKVERIRTISDFESAQAAGAAFTVCQEEVDFSGAPKLVRPTWAVPKLSYSAAGDEGRQGLLRIEHRGQEEIAFTGVKLEGEQKANAIALTLKATHESGLDELSLDMLLYEQTQEGQFPWEQLRPPASWREQKDIAFDYYLTEKATRDVSHAFFHARRAVKNGQWMQLVIPLSDFVCVFGGGQMRDAMMRQQPVNPSGAMMFGILPSYRQHRAPTVIEIDSISWVKVNEGDGLISFPQVRPTDPKERDSQP